jgi:hypothetical protein
MRSKETLFKRRLRRPLDEQTRAAISGEFARHRDRLPLRAEFNWHPEKPQFTISSSLLSFIVQFTEVDLVVDAELSLAARMLATPENRRSLVRFIESIANDLQL